MTEKPYTITLSPDEMEAWITFHSTRPLSFHQLLAALESAGVVFGIDQLFLQDLAEARQTGQAYPIAHGMLPEEGIEYCFPLQQERRPRRLPDGRVDFYNLDTIPNVIQQQILVTKVSPDERKAGKTVTGKTLLPLGQTSMLPEAGENVVLSADGDSLIALINGHPVLSGNVLSVSPTYTLEGDVDFSVGNLTFVGNLVIHGDVKSGFSIKCAQDVHIHGIVDDATIEAGGSVFLHGNVFGKHKSRIKSAGQVQALYVDSTTIEAQEDILLTRGARHSHLHTHGSVIVKGQGGHIIGGRVQAMGQIRAHDIGSANEVATRVEILSHLFEPETSGLVLRHIQSILHHDRRMLDQFGHQTLEKEQEVRAKIEQCHTALCELCTYFAHRPSLLPLSQGQMGTIVATGTVYPGVTICIGGASISVTQPLTGVLFYKSRGIIKTQTLEIALEELVAQGNGTMQE
jgi:hypothetical protein